MSVEQPEAAYYTVRDGAKIACGLCPHECGIAEGKTGICRSRKNIGGRLIATNYGRYVSIAVDPIEKKPLYHFNPGKDILSIGGKGCNFRCAFCQNDLLSQGDPSTREVTPHALAEEVKNCGGNNIGIAFTYNEPFIWFEFIRDTAPLVRENGQKVVLVTNGFVNEAPLSELLPSVDAMNVDLKAFEDNFYRKYCNGRLGPVKRTIEESVAAGVHVEVTLLVIPTLNDDIRGIAEQAEWIASLSKDIPLHLSRYFPACRLNIAPTPVKTLVEAHAAASEHLNYVYLGNTGDPEFSKTLCPECGNALIRRTGYSTEVGGLDNTKCGKCGTEIKIIRDA